MTTVTLKGNPIETVGELPGVGSVAPDFSLTKQDLSDASLDSYSGKKKLLNIFPSLDTSVCSASGRTFHEMAGSLPGVVVLQISMDLPFAQGRFCSAEGLENVETLSAFRSSFARDWGLQITTGPMEGLCSRCVIILDEGNRVVYTEQVPELVQEPQYERALQALAAKV